MSNLLENLNKEQFEAVTHTGGPLLIVAGAGTGKTTVITRRIAYLLEQEKVKPDQILALTFTEKAATEMLERVEQLMPLGSYDFWISTFHGFCERILQQHALDIGIPNNFKLLDEVKQWILIYKNFEKFELDYYRPAGNPNKFIEALVKHFSKCKDEMITPEQYLNYAEKNKLNFDSAEGVNLDGDEFKRIEEIANAYHVYQRLLLENEALDFGDLINYCLLLFQKRPSILKFYADKFKFVMVDEFQDTNFAQYQLIKMLSGSNLNKTELAVVGDDDQSIYKFRGASVSNILKLKEDFPKVKQITLVENYRSSQPILDLAYNFIQTNNPNRLESKLGIKKRLKSNTKTKGIIEVLEGSDLSDELNLVVNKIIGLKQSRPEYTWNDFAILIRANSAAKELMPKLDSAGITYSFVASQGLYKKPLIFDIISYLKLIDNYHDSQSLYRILQFPRFKPLPHDLATITYTEEKRAWSLYETLKNIDQVPGIEEVSKSNIQKLLGLLKEHSALNQDKTAAEIFIHILEDLGIPEMISGDTLENAQSRELLEQFYKRIEKFEEENDNKSLKNFIFLLDLEIQAGSEGPIKFNPELGPESLKILTIHSAKGLEFENVFIINMVEQRFPSRNVAEPIRVPEPLIKDILPDGDFHLQEERRLFYVAITRAKMNLYFSWGKDYGGSKTKRPSVFLQEAGLIPSEQVVRATGKVVFTKPTKKKATKYFRLPENFSFSEINVFKNCPLEYKYRYYLRIPSKGTASLSFGKSVHNTLYKFAQNYTNALEAKQPDLFGSEPKLKLPTLEDLNLNYQEEWISEWYSSKKDELKFKKMGQEMIKVFYDDLVTKKPTIKLLEAPFKMDLNGYNFYGRIDRIDETPDGWVIIDYKTGKPIVKHSRNDLDQLKVYQWAAQEYWHAKVTGLTYWYLKENKKTPIEPASESEITQLKKQLKDDIQTIIETIKYDRFNELHELVKAKHTCSPLIANLL